MLKFNKRMKYSIVIPVYNRPDEVDELLQSLTTQTFKDFEVVVVEDGSDIPCQEGDAAIIFGRDLPVSQLSDILGTIPYEILTSVSNRVKRVYYKK